MNRERSAPFLSLALSRRSWLFRVRMCIFLPVLVMDGGWVGQCLDVHMRTQTRTHTHTHTTTECSEGGKSAKQAGIGSRSDALIGAAFVPGRDVIMAATVTGSIEVQDCLFRTYDIFRYLHLNDRLHPARARTNAHARIHTHTHFHTRYSKQQRGLKLPNINCHRQRSCPLRQRSDQHLPAEPQRLDLLLSAPCGRM